MGIIRASIDAPDQRGWLTGTIPVGTMSSGMPVSLPYILVKGAQPGRTLWLHGQVHGDEVNGVVAAIQFARSLDPARMCGQVVVTPTVNLHGFDARQKRNPYDGIDMDQIFPGTPRGLISERMAYALLEEIKAAADVVISLHTMTPMFDSKPYAVYKHYPQSGISEDAILSALAPFYPQVACKVSTTSSNELPGNREGALDFQCLKAGILAFMLEVGGGSRLEPEFVRQSERGFLGLAQLMGILPSDGGIDMPAHVTRVTRRAWIYADHGGLFVADCEAGQVLGTGDVVGVTTSTAGEAVETIALSEPGLVIGIRNDPISHTGDRMAFIAHEWEQYAVMPRIASYTS